MPWVGGGGINWSDWSGPFASGFRKPVSLALTGGHEAFAPWHPATVSQEMMKSPTSKTWTWAVRKMRTSFAKLSEPPSPVSNSIYPVATTCVCVSDDSSLNELFHPHSVWRAVLLCSLLLSFMCLYRTVALLSPSAAHPSLILFFLSSSLSQAPQNSKFPNVVREKKKIASFRYQIVSM